jgi:hypothetical protein
MNRTSAALMAHFSACVNPLQARFISTNHVQIARPSLRLSNPGIFRQYNPVRPFDGELKLCLFP